jgi:iron complex outermembrane receptor protein
VLALRACAALVIFLGATLAPAFADTDAPADEVIIKGQRSSGPDTFTAAPDRATPDRADTAALLDLVPGGGVVDNGPLSGQVQYRGMFGERMNVRVNDMYINPGGPNWMDPPLHYAPRSLLDSIDVDLGIAPISSGAESIGGTVRAKLKKSEFGDGPDFRFGADLDLSGRTVDASVAGGALLSAANEHHRFELIGSAERGDDYDTPLGKVVPSQYERYVYGAGYGARFGAQEVGVEYRHNATKPTGTPALPMDIQFVDSELVNARYEGNLFGADTGAHITFFDVDHAMDNFTLREVPMMPQRQARAHGDGHGYGLDAAHGLFDGELAVGADFHHASHDMDVTDPDPTNAAFEIRNFNNATRNRYSVWAEWVGSPISSFAPFEVEAGVRYTRVSMNADTVAAVGLPMPPAQAAAQELADRFNNSNRERDEDLVDAVLRLSYDVDESLRIHLAGGRKTRAPSYIERYAWLPLEVTGGLADGKNYVGDIGLRPEVSGEVEGGVEWRTAWTYLAPRAFYRHIDDYIQGTPSTDPLVKGLSGMNGDPTPLEFSNVEAELYGVDLAYGLKLPFDLQIDGTLSYVRGKRKDIVDDLYRITPLRGRTTLSYMRSGWVLSVEGVYAASQNHVSLTNGETPTSAWGIMNLFASWEFREGMSVSAGVDNVTNAAYSDHLAGVARVLSPGTTPGVRLPAQGVSFHGRIGVVF